MQVDLLVPDVAVPDVAVPHDSPTAGRSGSDAFAQLVDAAGAVLERAERAEASFAAHRGGLQEMVVERARADIALQIATTAAQRAAQALSSLLGMQV